MSTTHFSNLTEDCAQLIFDRIPTHRLLLHIRRVCHAWHRHQQVNCRRRKSLIILQGRLSFCKFIDQIYNQSNFRHNIDQKGKNLRNHKAYILHNIILISPKNKLKVKYLFETFPHLHTLIVSTYRIAFSYHQSFTQFIVRYSAKLVTLQLYFDVEIQNELQETSMNNFVGNLINQLNSLSSLKHLTFHIADQSLKFDINPQIDEPEFLTRIKEFYFHIDGLENMLNWVRKYEQAGRLDQLERFYLLTRSIAWEIPSNNHNFPLANLYSFSPFEDCEHYEQNLKILVSTFPSLITFKQTMNKRCINSLTQLTTILSPLTKLVHLYLEIEDVPSNKPLNPNSTPQLTSLKALDLTFESNDPKLLPTFCQTQVSSIGHCFPNLQSIRITAEDYAVFDYDYENGNGDSSELKVCQIFHELKVAFGRPSLQTKYFDAFSHNYTLW